jgi:hypothetical protein
MYDIATLQKLKESPELQDLEWWKCHDDPYHWLTHWAMTLDVHDRDNPVKVFPEKEYIKIIVATWLKENRLLIPKTRQMMMSWLFTSLYLWDTQFHRGRLTFFQSKKLEDADDLVKRAKFVLDHEPKFLKRFPDGKTWHELVYNPQNQGKHIEGKLQFPGIYSEIRGIPEGGEIIRMHTASGILEDEMAYQPEARKAYTAAKPTISSQGRFTGVSTAEDSTFFEAMVFDLVEV